MKVLVNECYGAFSFSNGFLDSLDEKLKAIAYDARWSFSADRTNEELIKAFEEYERNVADASGTYAEVTVEEIPDDATDYLIEEHDGLEIVFFVLNGKIYTL